MQALILMMVLSGSPYDLMAAPTESVSYDLIGKSKPRTINPKTTILAKYDLFAPQSETKDASQSEHGERQGLFRGRLRIFQRFRNREGGRLRGLFGRLFSCS